MAKATIKNFKTWVENIGRFMSPKNIERVDDEGQCDDDGNYEFKYGVRIYTDNNVYKIVARETSGNQGYLGCVASSRKPRAGEKWTRGRDLADGSLTKETWYRILGDVVSYELVEVHRSTPAYTQDDEEINTDNVGPSLGDSDEFDESDCTTGETIDAKSSN